MIPETDQWKLRGDCSKCRRAPHCKKKCTARKKSSDAALRAVSNSIIDAVLPEPFASHAKIWR